MPPKSQHKKPAPGHKDPVPAKAAPAAAPAASSDADKPVPRQNAWSKPLAPAAPAAAPQKASAPAAAAAPPEAGRPKTGGTAASKGAKAKKGAPAKLNTGDLAEPKPATPPPQQQPQQQKQPASESQPAQQASATPSGSGATMVPGAFDDETGPHGTGPAAAAAAMIELMQQMPSEQEFVHTAQMVQFVAQPALVQVVRSLLEDFPFLVPHVRVRCDQAMANFLQQQQLGGSGNGASGMFGSGQGTPFMAQSPERGYGHAHATPTHFGGGRSPNKGGAGGPSPAGTSPAARDRSGPASSTKRGGGAGGRYGSRGEEEQDLCMAHGNMRAVKHLTFNSATRRVECIPGFHCLETRPLPTTAAAAAAVAAAAAASSALHGSKQGTPLPPQIAPAGLPPRATPPGSGVATPRSMATPSAPGQPGQPLLSAHSSVPPSPSKTKPAAEDSARPPERVTPMLQGATPPPDDAPAESGADRARLQALLSDLRT